MTYSQIIILGGSSQVTPFLLEKIKEQGLSATVTSRQQVGVPAGFEAHSLDINNPNGWEAPAGSIIISFIPVWIFAAHLDLFTKAKSLIVVSSTSRYGKAKSESAHEQETVKGIIEGEKRIQEWTTPQGPSTTILRPTLIYNYKTDKNITRIKRMIKKFGLFPIIAPANGKRQPIHASDVAAAAMGAIDNKDAMNRAFNIAGGEILSYRDMVIRIFKKMGKEPRLLVLPYWFIKVAMTFINMTRSYNKSDVSADMFARMNENLVFDNEDGLKVLGYKPRAFLKD